MSALLRRCRAVFFADKSLLGCGHDRSTVVIFVYSLGEVV
jgi:hypothetical protein